MEVNGAGVGSEMIEPMEVEEEGTELNTVAPCTNNITAPEPIHRRMRQLTELTDCMQNSPRPETDIIHFTAAPAVNLRTELVISYQTRFTYPDIEQRTNTVHNPEFFSYQQEDWIKETDQVLPSTIDSISQLPQPCEKPVAYAMSSDLMYMAEPRNQVVPSMILKSPQLGANRVHNASTNAVGYIKYSNKPQHQYQAYQVVPDTPPHRNPHGNINDPQPLFQPLLYKPTLPLLLSFPKLDGGKIKIVQRLTTKFQQLGILLLNDNVGAITSSLVCEHRSHVEQTNLAILQKWLEGNGKPRTWETFIAVLKEIGHGDLAKEIEDNLAILSTL